jgi:Predicted transcriptional regulators
MDEIQTDLMGNAIDGIGSGDVLLAFGRVSLVRRVGKNRVGKEGPAKKKGLLKILVKALRLGFGLLEKLLVTDSLDGHLGLVVLDVVLDREKLDQLSEGIIVVLPTPGKLIAEALEHGNEVLGARAAEARKKKGLTQAKVADLFNVSRVTVNQWENGKALPDLNTVLKMANVYEVSLDWLFSRPQFQAKEKKDILDELKKLEEKLK